MNIQLRMYVFIINYLHVVVKPLFLIFLCEYIRFFGYKIRPVQAELEIVGLSICVHIKILPMLQSPACIGGLYHH